MILSSRLAFKKLPDQPTRLALSIGEEAAEAKAIISVSQTEDISGRRGVPVMLEFVDLFIKNRFRCTTVVQVGKSHELVVVIWR